MNSERVNVLDPVFTDLFHLTDCVGDGDVDDFGSGECDHAAKLLFLDESTGTQSQSCTEYTVERGR